MRPRRSHATLVVAVVLATTARAADKNGVAPQAISLPSGPGSIQGLGESFQPQLNSGSGSYQVPLSLPKGTGGQVPKLALVYNSGAGNGSLGLGWSLSGVTSIRRNTDHGVPRYVDGPNGSDDDFDGETDNPEELDMFTGANGEELIQLPDGSFRAENESGFVRYTRAGGGWEARTPDGDRMLFGQSAAARVADGTRVFSWCLEREEDRNGNAIEYEYLADPAAPAQQYVRRIRWGQPAAFFGVVLGYEEGRPDAPSSFQSGFEVRTRLRVAAIAVFSQGLPAPAFAERADFDEDGKLDRLIRRYVLEYQPATHLSLLTRVTQLGADGLTALPPLSLAYSQWTPPDNVSMAVIRSTGAPATGFDSASVELIDMNGDGLPDLLSTTGSQHRVALNRGIDAQGRLAWAPGVPVGNAPSIDISSDRTHLADATADGLADLMVKVSNTSFLCYDNTSQNSWTQAPFPIRNTDTWPIWPYDGANGAMSRSFDSDYSRSNDILHTSQTGGQLWLLLPGGKYAREVRLPPVICEGKVFRFDLPGTRIADLNGDRLQDLTWIQANRLVWFPSRGRGDFGEPIILSLGRTLIAAEIERCGFSDIDGDGLVDLTLVRPTFEPQGVVYWLNRFGEGLEAARTVRGLPPLSSGDALRWADMNGNGSSDIAISQAQGASGEKVLVIDFLPEGKIHLLKRIENGLGLRIDLEYESSTAQMVRAAAEGTPWASVMPIAVTVVRRIAEDDGRGQVFDQTLTYRDPHYDAAKQEFRGFHRAEAHEAGDASAAGKVERLVFDTGLVSACLKGKTLSQEVRGEDGKLFQRSATSWNPRVLAVGIDGREVCFASQTSSDKFVHEGEVNGIHLREETDHDEYGNVTGERNFGILEEPGDELFVERTFAPRLDRWLLRLVATTTKKDGAGRLLEAQRFFYNAAGNAERTESWLDSEERWIAIATQSYDAFGNVIEVRDARGHRRGIAFDPLLHALATAETIHLEDRDLVMSAEYDLGFGAVTTALAFSGQRTEYLYDPLGRLVDERKPGGAAETYEYQFGNPVSLVIKRLRLDAQGASFDSYSYSDAYGRPLGNKIESEAGTWRFLEAKSYNARKLEARSWLPQASDTPEYTAPDPARPHEAHRYDAAGRVLETVKADGSLQRQEYRPLAVAVFDGNDTAEGGEPDLQRLDGLGRIASVEEHNAGESYVTRYTWDGAGRLEALVDALGNTRRFTFDSLGRLIAGNDPDRGERRTAYDDFGNVVRREDARGQVTLYRHDAANRVLEKDFQGLLRNGLDPVDSVYHYDAPAGELDFGDGTRGAARHTLGRLAWVEDPSGEEHFSFDERGNLEWVLKRLRDPDTGVLVPYRTQRSYDLLNREAEIVFADNDRLRYVRGEGGFIARIDGGPQGRVVLSAAEYAPNGQPTRLVYGNGVESLFAYDERLRLQSLRVEDASGSPLLADEIAYDGASNVVEVLDQRPLGMVPADSPRRRSAQFTYDALNRLVEASYGTEGGLGRLEYEYDALGNLLSQSTPAPGAPGHIADGDVNLGALGYQGGRSGRDGRRALDPPGPHAVTGTANGHRFAYDASGNLTTFDAGALEWDFEDRLERFSKAGVEASYLRDHASRRVLKRLLRGGAREETHYVDIAFEVKDGSPAKYAFLGERRIACIHGVLDPGRDTVQRLVLAVGWNLVAAGVESTARLRDAFGADAAIYEARAGSYVEVDPAVAAPFGKALWVHVPSARLAVLRGRVPAAAEGISPGPLHAWPSLEALRPAAHLEGAARLFFYDAKSRRWSCRDPAPPSFLNEAPAELGAAQAFWSADSVTLKPAAADQAAYYHLDHLGSPAARTDAAGELVEELARYPYGAVRNRHQPASEGGGEAGAARNRWDFTGKERDRESGIVEMGARGYLDLAGVFLSPDPRYADLPLLSAGNSADQASFAAFVANPQMGNLYAYATRNPLKYVDPSGFDVVHSKVLQDSPVFQEAWALFQKTSEGQRLLARIEMSGAKVTLKAGRVFDDRYGECFGSTSRDYNSTITINLLYHKNVRQDRDALILELADTIHHELRHAEGFVNARDLAGMRRNLDWIRNNALETKSRSSLPSDPTLWMGEEVHERHLDDPLNRQFRVQAEWHQLKAKFQEREPDFPSFENWDLLE